MRPPLGPRAPGPPHHGPEHVSPLPRGAGSLPVPVPASPSSLPGLLAATFFSLLPLQARAAFDHLKSPSPPWPTLPIAGPAVTGQVNGVTSPLLLHKARSPCAVGRPVRGRVRDKLGLQREGWSLKTKVFLARNFTRRKAVSGGRGRVTCHGLRGGNPGMA